MIRSTKKKATGRPQITKSWNLVARSASGIEGVIGIAALSLRASGRELRESRRAPALGSSSTDAEMRVAEPELPHRIGVGVARREVVEERRPPGASSPIVSGSAFAAVASTKSRSKGASASSSRQSPSRT